MPSFLPLVVLGVTVALAGCSPADSPAAADASASPPPRVATVVARRGAVIPRIRVPGVIVPYRTIGVSSALSEPIVRVRVRDGDVVRAGDVLAVLQTDDLEAGLAAARRIVNENTALAAATGYVARATIVGGSTDVRSAQANLGAAQVRLAAAQADLRRDDALTAQGYLPQQTADGQRAVVASDQQAVESSRAALAAAQATERANGDAGAGSQASQIAAASEARASAAESARQIERQLARAVIVAPVDGVVMSVNANPGEYPSGRQLFTIESNGRMYALLSATDDDAFSVGVGARAQVTPHGATRPLAGTVTAVLDQIAPGSTNFSIKVELPNPGLHLHAGMPVVATVYAPPVRGPRVPLTAFTDDERQAVWTVSNGRVHAQPVRVRADDETTAVVDGLAAGTRIVRNAQESGVAENDAVTL